MTVQDLEQLHFQTITNNIGGALYAGEHDPYTLGISLPLFEVIEDFLYEIGFQSVVKSIWKQQDEPIKTCVDDSRARKHVLKCLLWPCL